MIEAEFCFLKQTLGHHKDDKFYLWEAVLNILYVSLFLFLSTNV